MKYYFDPWASTFAFEPEPHFSQTLDISQLRATLGEGTWEASGLISKVSCLLMREASPV